MPYYLLNIKKNSKDKSYVFIDEMKVNWILSKYVRDEKPIWSRSH